ncbi:hypothetical protein BDR26DRAFT_1007500 [Obelidium mucronatum]|nr:hypothetical protein BDR26DRAFT_1007500 [Obelidium mucronatum]
MKKARSFCLNYLTLITTLVIAHLYFFSGRNLLSKLGHAVKNTQTNKGMNYAASSCAWLNDSASGLTDFLKTARQQSPESQSTNVESLVQNNTIPLNSLDELIFNHPTTTFLHQTWKSTCIPTVRRKEMLSWHQLPTEEFITIFYDDAAVDLWVRQRFTGTKVSIVWDWLADDTEYTLPAVRSSRLVHPGVKRSDLFRLMLMWYYGGLYMDVDVRFLQSWKPLLVNNTAFIAWEPSEKLDHAVAGVLAADGAGHPFFSFMLEHIIDDLLRRGRVDARGCHPVDCSGPQAIARAYHKYASICSVKGSFPVVALPNILVDGHGGDECPGCIVNHVGTCSWCSQTHHGVDINNCTEVADFMPKGKYFLVTQ